MKKRIYVILDKTLSDPQKVVQSSHLALESGYVFGRPKEGHPSIVILAVNPDSIPSLRLYLEKKGVKFIDFYENLLEKITGLATCPLTKEEGKVLQHLPMLKDKDFKGAVYEKSN